MPKKNPEDMLKGSLPEGAQQHITKYQIKMSRPAKRNKKKKYSNNPQLLVRNEGYDLLENMLVVRRYICKKYGIRTHFLEILLYLYPKDYFTWQDYYEMPKYFTYNRLGKLEKMEMVRICSKARTRKESLFCLTNQARTIVTNFYMFMFGEKNIPIHNNPLALASASAVDKMRVELIKKINKSEVSETKKRFFE